MGDKAEEGGSYGNLGCAYHSLGQFKTAIEYHQRHLEIAKEVGEISKEVGDKTGEVCSLCSLGSIFECQGNLMMAFDCYYLSVQLYDDIRASLQLNDRWKICYRNQHQSAYEGLWRINLNQGQVVKISISSNFDPGWWSVPTNAIVSGRRKPWKRPRLSSYFLAQLSPFFWATTHLTLPRPFRLHWLRTHQR